ncbi:MAG: TonB-dependent receptor plug domain-containing protein [Bacteroidota bacterium]
MNNAFFLAVFFFLSCFFKVQAQNHGPRAETHSYAEPESRYQMSQKDSLAIWREQVVLYIDAESYKPKETVFFKAYILTGPKKLRVSASDVLRVELLDGEGNLVMDQYHRIEGGAVQGILALPKKMEQGKYYLRAYTRWMLNYGEDTLPLKEVWVSDSNSREEEKSGPVAIFSESGSFVAGIENKGIVSDNNGNPINGVIVDEEGINAANVVDYGYGLGTFTFVPDIGKNYYFEKSNGQKISLIQPLEAGIVLQANTIEDKKVQIRIGATKPLREGTYYLQGTRAGKHYLRSEIIFDTKKDFVELDIKKEGLPHGILNLALVDINGQTWAERPLYIRANDLQLSLTEVAELSEDGTRKMRYTLKLSDLEGNPVSSELMVRLKDAYTTPNTIAIAKDKRGMSYLKDLQVLAQRVPEGSSITSENELPDQIKYAIQNGLAFYGQAYDFNNALLTDDSVQVYMNTKKDVEVQEVATNSEGLFTLIGLQFEGEVTMTFRKDGKNIREQMVKVIPYQYELPELKLDQGNVRPMVNPIRESEQLISQKRLSDFNFNATPSNLIPLEEVTLVGQRKLNKVTTSVYGIEPSRVVYQDPERPKTLPQLFLGVPGVYVSGIGDLNPSLSIPSMTGAGRPLWIIDGFPLSQDSYYASSSVTGFSIFEPSPLREVMDIVPYVDIERIEFLFGPGAAIYGTRGSGGVILIYTKNGSYSTDFLDRDQAQIVFKGFQVPVDVTQYFTSQNRRLTRSRNASTLYWNPLLMTDENGEASVELLVPDNTNSVLLEVEAIAEDGKRGSLRSVLGL